MSTQEEVNKAILPLTIGLILITVGFWFGGLMLVGFLLIGLACFLPMIRLWVEDTENNVEYHMHKRR